MRLIDVWLMHLHDIPFFTFLIASKLNEEMSKWINMAQTQSYNKVNL